MEGKLPLLTNKCCYVRSRITKLCTKIENELQDMFSQDISINIDICRDFRTEIMQFDKDCFDLCVELDYTGSPVK